MIYKNIFWGISAAIMSATLALSALSLTSCGNVSGSNTITNVSYDPTRELYAEYNEMFKAYYRQKTNVDVEIVQSHGGSGSQADSVIEGADADVVTLALAHDITRIENAGLIDPGWMDEFDLYSSPYTSTIVFLVRDGNEKRLKDWDDLIKNEVEIITPDPRTSGGACWSFLAAWNYASQKYSGEEADIMGFMRKLYDNVTVMDSGTRGSTNTFVKEGKGDVLIAWENEALQTMEQYPGEYEIVSPSMSILAEPSVAIVDGNAKKNGTEALASEYLSYLYSDEAQRLIGEKGYRPSNETILSEFSGKFDLSMNLCNIDDFGGWETAYNTFFKEGAVFENVYRERTADNAEKKWLNIQCCCCGNRLRRS